MPIPSYNPRCESSVGGKPPGRANTPWGIETGLMRFTFQTPGSVSWNPSDQVVTCVPTSVIPAIALSRSKRPRVKTRNSAFPRRDCWPALVCKSLIRTSSKCAWLRLANQCTRRIFRKRCITLQVLNTGRMWVSTPSASEFCAARRRS